MVHCGQAQVDFPGLPQDALSGQFPLRLRRSGLSQGVNPVAEELRRLLIPNGDFPLGDHRVPLSQVVAALGQRPGKDQQLHGAGVVLQCHIGH